MHSHGWGGEGKSLRDYKKPIRMPGLAQVIGAAECKKMGSCAIEAAASRHLFLVSFASVWWRRSNTIPRQDNCSSLMYTVAQVQLKKKAIKPQRNTDTYLINSFSACSPEKWRCVSVLRSGKLMLSTPWKGTVLSCSAGILNAHKKTSWSFLKEKPEQQVREHFLGKILSFNFFQFDIN